MNLLIVLLILVGIYISIYIYIRYYNYSIQDAGTVQIKKTNIEVPINQEKICKFSDTLIKKYIDKNYLNKDNSIFTNTQIPLQINSSNYIDSLIKNANLDIKIPETDNPNCIDKKNQNIEQLNKNKNLVDLYLIANSRCKNKDNFD